jgi:hypothetical protein
VLNYWTEQEGSRATINKLRRIFSRLQMLTDTIANVLDDRTLDVDNDDNEKTNDREDGEV